MALNKKGGLGKGLDALFLDNSTEERGGSVTVSLNDIEPNRDQPRKDFDEEALSELAESIALHGVIQPLLVRPISDGGYQLVAGERRWRASRMAGLTEVPVFIREMSDRQVAEVALIENLQREDLNPLEEAKGYAQLMKDYSLTQEQVAKSVGKSRPAVANAMRILELPEEVLEYVRNGKLSAGHARTLLPIKDKQTLLKLAEEIVLKDISVRETERIVKSLVNPKKEKSPAKKAKRDSWYDECELAIKAELGRKASIHTEKGNRGTIEIEFFSKEDLQGLLEALTR